MLMFCYNVNTPKRKERCYVIFIRKSEKVRVQKNLTQEDIAEYLGVTPQSVSKWER